MALRYHGNLEALNLSVTRVLVKAVRKRDWKDELSPVPALEKRGDSVRMASVSLISRHQESSFSNRLWRWIHFLPLKKLVFLICQKQKIAFIKYSTVDP